MCRRERPKAIIFDLFGTLVSAPWSKFVESSHEMASILGIDGDLFFKAWTEQTSDRRNTGAFSSIAEEVLWICEQKGVKPSKDALKEAVEIRIGFTRSILKPRQDAVSTLKELRDRGFLSGLISDCSIEVPKLWQETPFVGLFDVEIFSCLVGVRKPDPAIFGTACERLDVRPEECFFIGDGFSREMTGAKAFGMRPFLIMPPDEDPPKTDKWEGTAWKGDVVTSLSEILDILKMKETGPNAEEEI